MIKNEFPIGNYTGQYSISPTQRRKLIEIVETLHGRKGYKEETLYIAVSVADRYLVNLMIKQEPIPCLTSLAVICTLLGAKIEQPMHPSFNIMLKLFKETYNVTIEKKALLQLEVDIL